MTNAGSLSQRNRHLPRSETYLERMTRFELATLTLAKKGCGHRPCSPSTALQYSTVRKTVRPVRLFRPVRTPVYHHPRAMGSACLPSPPSRRGLHAHRPDAVNSGRRPETRRRAVAAAEPWGQISAQFASGRAQQSTTNLCQNTRTVVESESIVVGNRSNQPR